MINLTKYYIDNYKTSENKYYKQVCSLSSIKDYDLEVIDFADLIEKWKICLYPGASDEGVEKTFYLASFYLHNNGYVVDQHPNMLSKIKSPDYISDGELKSATGNKFGRNGSMSGVSWADRRRYVDELALTKKFDNEIPLLEDIDELMETVSTRNATFREMPNDEKLMNIRNVFENIGKKDGKYLKIPFEDISLGYIKDADVLKYANELQCFRHGEEKLIEKRTEYTERDKEFLIDYGKIILNIVSKHFNDTKAE